MEYIAKQKIINSIQPLVSVCIVTYNHKDYIRQCLDSVLCQKCNFPVEIILGEDESDDGTREICIEYAEKYSDKLRLFLRSRKDVIFIKGQPSGRFNFLENLKAARGKYIAFCDGDDYWTDPLKLQNQVDLLENNSHFSMCCTNFSIIDKAGNLIKERAWKNKKLASEITHYTMLGHYIPKLLTSTVRNSAFPIEFPPEMYKVRNPDNLFFSIVSLNGPAAFINEITACYREQTGGIWSGKTLIQKKKMWLNTFPLMKDYFPSKEQKNILKARINRITKSISIDYFNEKMYLKAITTSYSKTDGSFFEKIKAVINLIKTILKRKIRN